MNPHHYEALSQDQDLLSFTCLREAANYSAGLPDERKRLESWDAGYEAKARLSTDFDFFNLRLPFGEDAVPGRAAGLAVGVQLLAAVEQFEAAETAAEVLSPEEAKAGAPGCAMRIRLRRTSHEVVVDDGAAEARLEGKTGRQVLSESERLQAKLVKTRQFWQKNSALIPSVFRLARLFDETQKSLFEFQDLSGKHLLVQNYHKSREANAESRDSSEAGNYCDESGDSPSNQFLTPF